jgi:hypothetical protein
LLDRTVAVSGGLFPQKFTMKERPSELSFCPEGTTALQEKGRLSGGYVRWTENGTWKLY